MAIKKKQKRAPMTKSKRLPKMDFPMTLKSMNEMRIMETEKNEEAEERFKRCSSCTTCKKKISAWKGVENTGKLGCYYEIMRFRTTRMEREKRFKEKQEAQTSLSKILMKEIKKNGPYSVEELKKMPSIRVGLIMKMYGVKTVGINEKYMFKLYQNTVKNNTKPVLL